MNRRDFFLASTVSLGSLAPAIAQSVAQRVVDPIAAGVEFWLHPRWVWLHRPVTGETIRTVYWQDGQIIESAYREISWFLRDVRFERMLKSSSPVITNALDRGVIGRAHLTPWALMDPFLIDILYAYCAWLNFYGIQKPVLVTSGLRHVLTNAMTEGAARDSWHTKGGAADIVIPGVPSAQMALFGRWLSGGGVGLYLAKNFVHVDRGRVRTWLG